jgi:acetyl-CoA acetyltransferase
LGARDLSRSAGAELAARKALEMANLSGADQVDLVELAAANPVEEMILREALGLARSGDTKPAISPSGGALTGNPLMMTGLIRMGEVFRQLSGQAGERAVGGAKRAIAHASQGHCLQQNLLWVLGHEPRWT